MPKVTGKRPRKNSRTKGCNHELEVANIFSEWAGEARSFKRRWSGRAETRVGGDLIVPAWFPWIIECRKREDWRLNDLFRVGPSSVPIKWWNTLVKKNKTEKMLLVFTKNFTCQYVMFKNKTLRDKVVRGGASMILVRYSLDNCVTTMTMTVVELSSMLAVLEPDFVKEEKWL